MDITVPSPWGLPPSQAKRIQDIAAAIIYLSNGNITPGKLNKLLYIAELKFIREFSRRLSPARIMHWKHGPYSFDLEEALDYLDGDIIQVTLHDTGTRGAIRIIEPAKEQVGVRLSDEEIEWLKDFCKEWGGKDYRGELQPYAYATIPFAETLYHQVIDLEKYADMPDTQREIIDYAPDEEMEAAIAAAVKAGQEGFLDLKALVDG